MDGVLEAKGVRKSYDGREVVAGIDLALAKGECYGLLGPNGAGKTTTLRMLLGLTAPDAGTISLLGHPVPQAAREGRIRVGVVPQMDNLDPDFTVAENLLVYGRYFGIPAREVRERLPQQTPLPPAAPAPPPGPPADLHPRGRPVQHAAALAGCHSLQFLVPAAAVR